LPLNAIIIAFPAALALDLVIGDPRRLPHPVRWMGRAICLSEPLFRKLPFPLVFSGSLFAVCLVALTWLSGFLLVHYAAAVHPFLLLAVDTVLLYYCIAVRSLRKSIMAVFHALEGDSIDAARQELAMIVGRDVAELDAAGVSRAAVETVAKNLVQGILSPLFYAVIGGAPLCLAFKMISTLDAMVRHQNERYRLFGRAGAWLDDAVNFIPARLSVPLIALCGRLLLGRGRGRQALAGAVSDGRRHASPNSGFPKAAFAGALSIKLGGPNHYNGKLVKGAVIGRRFPEATPLHIRKACTLMVLASLTGFGIFWACLLIQGGTLI
jgi:adenosylcobinamide-phosphate synthase